MISITDKTQIDELDAEFASPKPTRMLECGMKRSKLDASTKRKFWYTFRCGYMDCAVCRREAAKKEQERIKRSTEPLYLFETDYANRESMTRMIGSENLRWYPQDEHLICITTERVAGTKLLVEQELAWWEELVHTPTGRRKSGKLGAEPAPEPDPDAIACHQPEFSVRGVTREQDMAAYRATLAADISPADKHGVITEDSLQAAIRRWIDIYSAELHALGGELVLHRWMKRLIDPATIDWNITDKTYLKTYNAANVDELLDIYANIDCDEVLYEENLGESGGN